MAVIGAGNSTGGGRRRITKGMERRKMGRILFPLAVLRYGLILIIKLRCSNNRVSVSEQYSIYVYTDNYLLTFSMTLFVC